MCSTTERQQRQSETAITVIFMGRRIVIGRVFAADQIKCKCILVGCGSLNQNGLQQFDKLFQILSTGCPSCQLIGNTLSHCVAVGDLHYQHIMLWSSYFMFELELGNDTITMCTMSTGQKSQERIVYLYSSTKLFGKVRYGFRRMLILYSSIIQFPGDKQ